MIKDDIDRLLKKIGFDEIETTYYDYVLRLEKIHYVFSKNRPHYKLTKYYMDINGHPTETIFLCLSTDYDKIYEELNNHFKSMLRKKKIQKLYEEAYKKDN